MNLNAPVFYLCRCGHVICHFALRHLLSNVKGVSQCSKWTADLDQRAALGTHLPEMMAAVWEEVHSSQLHCSPVWVSPPLICTFLLPRHPHNPLPLPFPVVLQALNSLPRWERTLDVLPEQPPHPGVCFWGTLYRCGYYHDESLFTATPCGLSFKQDISGCSQDFKDFKVINHFELCLQHLEQ